MALKPRIPTNPKLDSLKLTAEIKPSDFFLESTYLDGKGEIRPCCLLTKKGCDMVANKLTGQKGVLFTAAYVTAFEQMRERIKTGKALWTTNPASSAPVQWP